MSQKMTNLRLSMNQHLGLIFWISCGASVPQPANLQSGVSSSRGHPTPRPRMFNRTKKLFELLNWTLADTSIIRNPYPLSPNKKNSIIDCCHLNEKKVSSHNDYFSQALSFFFYLVYILVYWYHTRVHIL